MYVCTYEWHLLSLRREDEILSFTIQFSVFFTLARCLCSTCSINSVFLVTFFFFLLTLISEAQEKQLEILSACKCNSEAGVKQTHTFIF
jgi:hypothetical protein